MGMIRDTSATDVVVPQARRNPLRRYGIPAAVIVVAVAIAWPALSRWSSATQSVALERLRLGTVARGKFVSDVSAQGRVVAAVSPTLYAPAMGRVELKVQAGDTVQKNQLLALVDSPEVTNEYAREQQNLLRQRIDVRSRALANRQAVDLAQVTVAAAERELKRVEEAHAKGGIARLEVDRRADELATAKVRYQHAQEEAKLADEGLALELSRQQLLVENLARRVSDLSVRAPVAGVVGTVAVNDRAAVVPNQPLLTVVDLSAYEIEILVPESYADALGIGIGAEIVYGQQRLPGKLSALSPEVTNNQVVARVRFAGETPKDLRQNQRVSVRVVLDERDGILMVSRGPFYEAGGGRSAFVLSDGVARRVPIRTGATSIAAIEVLEGLQEGDQVVISGAEGFGEAESLLVND
jgi:HlyD family secretion protein